MLKYFWENNNNNLKINSGLGVEPTLKSVTETGVSFQRVYKRFSLFRVSLPKERLSL